MDDDRHEGSWPKPFDAVHTALATADVVAAVIAAPEPRRPVAEVLIARRSGRAAHDALDRLEWRWRYGGDGLWRIVPRRSYRFDGGSALTVHLALPAAPWPPGVLRRLGRAILAQTDGKPPGLVTLPDGVTLAVAAVEAARDGFRSEARLEALAGSARESGDPEACLAFARNAGVERVVEGALRAAALTEQGTGVPPTPEHPSAGALATMVRRGSRLLPPRLRALRTGQPVGAAVVRCRFGGVELLAGPGVFLPRKVTEPLVRETLRRSPTDAAQTIVEVGTASGAAALAVAHARPGGTFIGTELDAVAVRWARRNARRLRVDARFYTGSLLEPLPRDLRGNVDIVMANLPSIPARDFSRNVDAPPVAYVGHEEDGLGLHRRLAAQAREVLRPDGRLILQMSPRQWATFGPELETLGYELDGVTEDDVAAVGAARLPSGARPR